MTRPGNKILQFACSNERGKTERVGGGTCAGRHGNVDRVKHPNAHTGAETQAAQSADSLWSTSHFNFHHKRPNGTFVNGPEAMDSIARGVILTVLLATLVGLGFWLCWGFSQAENAIIHRLGGK